MRSAIGTGVDPLLSPRGTRSIRTSTQPVVRMRAGLLDIDAPCQSDVGSRRPQSSIHDPSSLSVSPQHSGTSEVANPPSIISTLTTSLDIYDCAGTTPRVTTSEWTPGRVCSIAQNSMPHAAASPLFKSGSTSGDAKSTANSSSCTSWQSANSGSSNSSSRRTKRLLSLRSPPSSCACPPSARNHHHRSSGGSCSSSPREAGSLSSPLPPSAVIISLQLPISEFSALGCVGPADATFSTHHKPDDIDAAPDQLSSPGSSGDIGGRASPLALTFGRSVKRTTQRRWCLQSDSDSDAAVSLSPQSQPRRTGVHRLPLGPIALTSLSFEPPVEPSPASSTVVRQGPVCAAIKQAPDGSAAPPAAEISVQSNAVGGDEDAVRLCSATAVASAASVDCDVSTHPDPADCGREEGGSTTRAVPVSEAMEALQTLTQALQLASPTADCSSPRAAVGGSSEAAEHMCVHTVVSPPTYTSALSPSHLVPPFAFRVRSALLPSDRPFAIGPAASVTDVPPALPQGAGGLIAHPPATCDWQYDAGISSSTPALLHLRHAQPLTTPAVWLPTGADGDDEQDVPLSFARSVLKPRPTRVIASDSSGAEEDSPVVTASRALPAATVQASAPAGGGTLPRACGTTTIAATTPSAPPPLACRQTDGALLRHDFKAAVGQTQALPVAENEVIDLISSDEGGQQSDNLRRDAIRSRDVDAGSSTAVSSSDGGGSSGSIGDVGTDNHSVRRRLILPSRGSSRRTDGARGGSSQGRRDRGRPASRRGTSKRSGVGSSSTVRDNCVGIPTIVISASSGSDGDREDGVRQSLKGFEISSNSGGRDQRLTATSIRITRQVGALVSPRSSEPRSDAATLPTGSRALVEKPTPPRRRYVVQRLSDVVPATPQQEASGFVRRRRTLALNLYKEWNKKVFGDQLPTELPIIWNPRLLSTAGQVVDDGSQHLKKTWLGQRIPTSIQLSTKVLDCEARLRHTLAHEMCHVANWVLDGADCRNRNSHGQEFWKWAHRFHAAVPDVEITQLHEFRIHMPFRWVCSNAMCGREYSRHTQSINIERQVCGLCRHKLRYDGKFDRSGHRMEPSVHQANAFSGFVKQHYSTIKKSLPPGTPHGHIMKQMSIKWTDSKTKLEGQQRVGIMKSVGAANDDRVGVDSTVRGSRSPRGTPRRPSPAPAQPGATPAIPRRLRLGVSPQNGGGGHSHERPSRSPSPNRSDRRSHSLLRLSPQAGGSGGAREHRSHSRNCSRSQSRSPRTGQSGGGGGGDLIVDLFACLSMVAG